MRLKLYASPSDQKRVSSAGNVDLKADVRNHVDPPLPAGLLVYLRLRTCRCNATTEAMGQWTTLRVRPDMKELATETA
jgi:hypothetical protein